MVNDGWVAQPDVLQRTDWGKRVSATILPVLQEVHDHVTLKCEVLTTFLGAATRRRFYLASCMISWKCLVSIENSHIFDLVWS